MDLVLKLRELRKYRGLSQAEAARQSGIGIKTLSSFETGDRIASMKLVQLQRLLRVYGVTEAEFFSGMIEHLIAPWEYEGNHALDELIGALRALPDAAQQAVIEKIRLAVDLVLDLSPVAAGSRRTSRATAANRGIQ